MKSKWTKKDIEKLKSQLMTFVLQNEMYYPMSRILVAIEKDPQSIILSNLNGFRSILTERAKRDKETADHFQAHPSIYGLFTPDMVLRFRKLHAECEKDIARIDALIARVQSEGLPPEVVGHIPERRR
jgi:hypothetical protein